jgi:DNA-directed RNA polymerase specialized sigma24 family protein
VVEGNTAALDELIKLCLRELPRRLRRAFPRQPWDLSVDAVSDACLLYATGASARVPAGAPVMNYLYRIAWRRLNDARRAAVTRAARERRWASEQPTTVDPDDIRHAFDVCGLIASVTKNELERRAAELWLDGAPTDAIAAALGAAHLRPADRRRIDKQFKDRLIKRMSGRLPGPSSLKAESKCGLRLRYQDRERPKGWHSLSSEVTTAALPRRWMSRRPRRLRCRR